MKKFLNTTGYIGTLLIFTGATFKIQKVPGANVLIVLGVFIFCIFYLPFIIYNQTKKAGGTKEKSKTFVGLFCLLVLILGGMFKLQHWPGAGIMLIISLVSFGLIFMPLFLISKLEGEENKTKRTMLKAGVAAISFLVTGFLFMILEWPYQNIFFTGSILLAFGGYFPKLIKLHRDDPESKMQTPLLHFLILIFSTGMLTMLFSGGSKFLMDSIASIEKRISENASLIGVKNKECYSTLSESGKVKKHPCSTKAIKVKELSDDLYIYISNLKIHLINEVEGGEKKDSVDLSEVNAKDNFDIPTHILIGDPDALRETKFSARELKNKIAVYKMDLLSLVNEDKRNELSKIIGLETNDPIKKDKYERASWEEENFYHSPLVVVITTLSQLQSNIRYAESEVLTCLISEVN